MAKELSNLLSKLNKCIFQNDFIDIAYEVIEEVEEMDDADEAITPILELMERNPNVDFGMPGPLVHFVEKYYKNGYEEKLVNSLRRLPTKHTLWMLNRIINGSEGNNKKYLISILDEVCHYPNIDVGVADLAKHYKSLHV